MLRDLSSGQQTAIHASSVALLIGGGLVSRQPRNRQIDRSYRPSRLDLFMRNLMPGRRDTVTNFIDSNVGGAGMPAAALLAVSIIDIERQEFSRDVTFYLSGLAATNGITAIIKTIAKRPRPYCLPGGRPPPELPLEAPDHHRSFVSGHASMAFYGAAFFNLRFRRAMRLDWTRDEYRVGRWASPILSFGCASFVGLSRIHADKHYFTDVLAGAILGTALAELYYWLAYDTIDARDSAVPNGLHLSIRFSL